MLTIQSTYFNYFNAFKEIHTAYKKSIPALQNSYPVSITNTAQ